MCKKLSKYAFCFFILSLICIIFSYAEENKINLSLEECISLALESNSNIRIQRINQKIQDNLITIAQGRFDPSITFGPNISSVEEPSSTPGITGADVRSSNSQGFSLGITDPIVTGGSYGLSFSTNRSKSNSTFQTFNPAYSSGLSFNITQPLLKGFGMPINKAPIKIAKNDKEISVLQLESELIRTVSEVENYYWELVFAIENLKVQQLSLKQAQDLLKKNIRFKEEGIANASDILQAQSAVASREADVIAAKDAVKDAEDRLKRVTNIIQDDSKWDISIVPLDEPSFRNFDVKLKESIDIALENSPEYIQAKKELENINISLKVAKNQRLPNLDLEGSLELNGLGDELDEPLSQVGKVDYDTWRVGLFFRMPIGGRVASSELKKSQYEKERMLLAIKELEQQITADVRGAIRQLQTNRERVEATKSAEEFAKQALDVEEKKYELGLSNSFELLQFQANLANVSKNRLRAIIDYNKSIVSFYQIVGVTLDNLNIELEY